MLLSQPLIQDPRRTYPRFQEKVQDAISFFQNSCSHSIGIFPSISSTGNSSHSSNSGAISLKLSDALYIMISAIVESQRRERCQVATCPDMLNILSTEHPEAGTARVSLTIFARSGNEGELSSMPTLMGCKGRLE